MNDVMYKEESYAIVGVGMTVYNEIGHGFHEAVYQECVEIEMQLNGLRFERQKSYPLSYRGHALRQSFLADLVCYDQIVVEIKAVSEICNAHRSQVLNYLKASRLRLGLLMNFGNPSGLQFERLVR